MARILKPPMPLEWSPGERTLFLAGSIEMGSAPPWQAQVEQALADTSVVMLNPRRDEWDASWSQEATDPRFRGQVEWELEAQERADLIAMYFAPATRAPITLLELGLFARTGRLLVCCPPGYWRKGNVDVVCQRYGVRTVESLDTLVTEVRRMLVP